MSEEKEKGFSYESPEKQKKGATATLVFEVVALLIIIVVILTLNYFGVFPISKLAPNIFGWLPVQNADETVSAIEAKPGRCLILEASLCDSLKLLDNPNYPGSKILFGKVPFGTKLYAPEDGKVVSVDNLILKDAFGKTNYQSGYNFFNIKKGQAPGSETRLYGIIVSRDKEGSIDKNLSKGEVIATAGLQKLNYEGDYNLAFYVLDIDHSNGKLIDVTSKYR